MAAEALEAMRAKALRDFIGLVRRQSANPALWAAEPTVDDLVTALRELHSASYMLIAGIVDNKPPTLGTVDLCFGGGDGCS